MVLGVHTPELSSERNVTAVQRNARESGLAFPVLIDNDRISVGPVGAFGSFGANLVNAAVSIVIDGREIGRAGLHEKDSRAALIHSPRPSLVETP